MIALLCFVLNVLISPFKSKSRLEAENAALRHQVVVLRRIVHRRVRLTNSDRLLRSDFIVISAIISKYPAQVRLAQYDDMVKTLARFAKARHVRWAGHEYPSLVTGI